MHARHRDEHSRLRRDLCRRHDPKIRSPKAVRACFEGQQSDDERAIKALIDEFNDEQATKFEEELLMKRKRLTDAVRIRLL
jgi:hypothetical protein